MRCSSCLRSRFFRLVSERASSYRAFPPSSGHTIGPFGGDGGYHFEARPPDGRDGCYLAWISGRADLRLDAISFHWRCPPRERRKRKRKGEDGGSLESTDFESMNGGVANSVPYMVLFSLAGLVQHLFS